MCHAKLQESLSFRVARPASYHAAAYPRALYHPPPPPPRRKTLPRIHSPLSGHLHTPEPKLLATQHRRAFGTDGVIMFSDILTPLPSMGIEFDVIKGSGPLIPTPIRSMDQVRISNRRQPPHPRHSDACMHSPSSSSSAGAHSTAQATTSCISRGNTSCNLPGRGQPWIPDPRLGSRDMPWMAVAHELRPEPRSTP